MPRVLLLEDDKLLGKELVAAFTEEGIDVSWARGLKEVYEALKITDFRVAFLDIMLAGEEDNGLAVLKKIKSTPELNHMKVIMLTNVSPMADIDRATALGADDYILKATVDMKHLIEIALKYL